jgi:hypothetical protein
MYAGEALRSHLKTAAFPVSAPGRTPHTNRTAFIDSTAHRYAHVSTFGCGEALLRCPYRHAHDPQNREPLAWTGVLEGFADRLRSDLSRPAHDAALAAVERGIVQRLDRQYADVREIYQAHATSDR